MDELKDLQSLSDECPETAGMHRHLNRSWLRPSELQHESRKGVLDQTGNQHQEKWDQENILAKRWTDSEEVRRFCSEDRIRVLLLMFCEDFMTCPGDPTFPPS